MRQIFFSTRINCCSQINIPCLLLILEVSFSLSHDPAYSSECGCDLSNLDESVMFDSYYLFDEICRKTLLLHDIQISVIKGGVDTFLPNA